MNVVHGGRDVLSAAGGVMAWCRSIAGTSEGSDRIDRSLRAACESATDEPDLVPWPLLGSCLAEVTETSPPDAPGTMPEGRPRIDVREPPATDDVHFGTRYRVAGHAPAPPRAREATRPPRNRPRSAGEAPDLGGSGRGSPASSLIDLDRTLCARGPIRPTVLPQKQPVHSSPADSEIGTRAREGLPPTVEARGEGAGFAHAVAASALRCLEADDSAIMAVLGQVPRPGPGAPPTAFPPAASRPIDPSPGGRTHDGRSELPNVASAEAHDEASVRDAARTPADDLSTRHPVADNRAWPVADRATWTAPVEPAETPDESGETPDEPRLLPRFAEMPAAAPRDRVSDPRRPPGPDTAARLRTEHVAVGVDPGEFERLMERIVHDAARRHGIEV